MTTELEQKFFKVFEVEPKIDYDYKTIIQNVTKTGYWFDKEYLIKIFNDNQKFKVIQVRKNINYPKITDRKLLEMICVIVQSRVLLPIFISENLENLKDEIIQMTINAETKFKHNNKIDLKHQIQQLFKEEE